MCNTTVGSNACDFPYVILLGKKNAFSSFGVFYDIVPNTDNGSVE